MSQIRQDPKSVVKSDVKSDVKGDVKQVKKVKQKQNGRHGANLHSHQ